MALCDSEDVLVVGHIFGIFILAKDVCHPFSRTELYLSPYSGWRTPKVIRCGNWEGGMQSLAPNAPLW